MTGELLREVRRFPLRCKLRDTVDTLIVRGDGPRLFALRCHRTPCGFFTSIASQGISISVVLVY